MIRSSLIALFVALLLSPTRAAQFTVGTYNLELYLDAPAGTMRAKPDIAKAKIREAIKAMNVDVLAVEEMGDTPGRPAAVSAGAAFHQLAGVGAQGLAPH